MCVVLSIVCLNAHRHLKEVVTQQKANLPPNYSLIPFDFEGKVVERSSFVRPKSYLSLPKETSLREVSTWGSEAIMTFGPVACSCEKEKDGPTIGKIEVWRPDPQAPWTLQHAEFSVTNPFPDPYRVGEFLLVGKRPVVTAKLHSLSLLFGGVSYIGMLLFFTIGIFFLVGLAVRILSLGNTRPA